MGIPNLLYGYIFRCWWVAYHFQVTVILTYDLVSRIIVSGAYPILFDVGIPNLVCWFFLGWRGGAYHFGSLLPWHWLLASFLGFLCLEHISYITAKFPRMCLMLDQFLWGHSSCYCDISCSYWRMFFKYCKCVVSATLFVSIINYQGINKAEKGICTFLYPPQTLFVVGYTVFTLSVRACVRPCVRPSVRP